MGNYNMISFCNINMPVKNVSLVIHRAGQDSCQENYFEKSSVLHTHAKKKSLIKKN